MSETTQASYDAVVGQVDRGVRPLAKPCDCMEQVNAKLMEKGYVLAVRDIVRFASDGQPSTQLGTAPLLKTEKINSKAKGRAPGVYGPFCMFCGQRRWPEA